MGLYTAAGKAATGLLGSAEAMYSGADGDWAAGFEMRTSCS